MAAIGFIGLGNMGAPMAGNLVKKGHAVKGFDLVAANLEAAAKRGVTTAKSAADAVANVDIVVTMLPAGKHVLSVYGDILKAAKPGTLFIDSSTIDVASARAAHALAAEHKMASLDAPVSGGVGGAEAATLTFMAGGAEDAFARGKPIIEAMAKRVVHCGAAGAGQAAKICNNMILGISMIGVCEAFVLAEEQARGGVGVGHPDWGARRVQRERRKNERVGRLCRTGKMRCPIGARLGRHHGEPLIHGATDILRAQPHDKVASRAMPGIDGRTQPSRVPEIGA